MKFKQQQKITQFRYEVASRRDKLHFSDLLHTYVFMPHIYVLQLIEILPSVTNGP